MIDGIRRTSAAGAFVAGAMTLLAGAALANVGEGTPLVLKDGRIATVSVHSIPFVPGSADLGAGADAALTGILLPSATDCFLTAQAIGHVEPESSDDSFESHRLARARADVIRDRLMTLGIPEASIASVWDWQFQKRHASATLWIFELTRGEDCQGTPLEAAQIVAAEAQTNTPQAPVEPAAVRSAELASEANAGLSAQATGATDKAEVAAELDEQTASEPEAQLVAKAPNDTAVVLTERRDLLERAREATTDTQRELSEPASTEAEAPSVASTPPQAVDAQADSTEASTVEQDVASDEPPEIEPAEAISDAQPIAEAAPLSPEPETLPRVESQEQVVAAVQEPEPSVAQPTEGPQSSGASSVIFDLNSSWMTPRQTAAVDKIVAALPPSGAYSMQLTAAIGAGDVNSANRAEDVKYNRWMAERRIARVEAYLRERLAGSEVMIVPRYRENDNSRAVEITATPQG